MSTDNNILINNETESKVSDSMEEKAAAIESTGKIPSMEDYKDVIDRSFRKIHEGDILKGTVIGISDTEVSLDLKYYTEGIIRAEEYSNDPGFSIKSDVKRGEEVQALVLSTDDGHGNILLSKRRADDILAWDMLTGDMVSRKVVKARIAQAVKGGVVAYLYGIRAFIPASQLSSTFVEDLESWVGREIEAYVTTASAKDKKLVLSCKELEREREQQNREVKINRLQSGIVITGTVEKIMPYGAFVNIGEGLTGLVHISRISERRIKSPNEVLKEGDTVTVKIIEVKDGKISLSMTDIDDNEEVVEEAEFASSYYSSGEEATTGLGDLLRNIKLK